MARPAYLPTWIAGICLYLLVASGIVAVVRSIQASYCSIPDDDASSKLALAPSGSVEARADAPQADVGVPRNTANRRNRVRCLKCGVIESMRQIVGQDTADVKPVEGVSSGVSGGAVAASAVAGKRHEITVRFRDGSTTVLNEASPRTLQLGGRVIVIGRSNAENK